MPAGQPATRRRYEDQRSVVFTTDRSDLGVCIGDRAFSRLQEMCGEFVAVEGADARATY